MIKQLFFVLAILCSSYIAQLSAKTVEIEVHGMTCAFCVDSLQRKLSELNSVSKVQVSLKLKKVRIETDKKGPSIKLIKQTVLDAGFTPTKVTVLDNATAQN